MELAHALALLKFAFAEQDLAIDVPSLEGPKPCDICTGTIMLQVALKLVWVFLA